MKAAGDSLPWHERLQWRLVLAFVGVLTVSALLPAGYYLLTVERLIQETVLSELEKSADVSRHLVELASRQEEDVQALLTSIGSRSGLRVTWIGPDGRVLADSHTGENLSQIENHGMRPEVRAALTEGLGQSRRVSATVGEEFAYVALRASAHEGDEGHVLRVALPYEQIGSRVRGARLTLVFAILVALLAGGVLAGVLARQLAEPVRALHPVALALSQGRFNEPMPPKPRGEAAVLHRALEMLRVQVADKVQQLEEEKQLLLTIVGAMTEGLVVVDATGRVILVNPRALELCGVDNTWTVADAEGRLLIEVTRLARLNEVMERTIMEAEEQRDELQTTRRPVRSLGVSSAPLREGDAVRGAVLAFFDLTTIRQLERVRQDFVANVSHELRTPIAAIVGWAETLSSGALDLPSFAEEKILVMLAHGRRLSALVDDLLVLTRLESIGLEGRSQEVEVEGLIEEVLDSLQEVVEERKVELEVDLDPALETWRGDERALTYIVRNLLENAMKYGHDSVTVTLRMEPSDFEGLHIVVTDNGRGIESRHLHRIFERFYRVDQGRSRDVGGTGLGLSIVKHFVQAVGGRIEVESEVGMGSTFRVWLPGIRESNDAEEPLDEESLKTS